MSGRRSRNKGARIEREILRALHGKGFAAARIPLSGAVGGRFSGDVPFPLMGCDFCVEGQGGRIPRIVLLARWS
jgi:hypothetical protein